MPYLITLGLAVGLWAAQDGLPPRAGKKPNPPEPPFAAELTKLKSELAKLEQEQRRGYAADLPEGEKLDRLVREYEALQRDGRPLVERALALVKPHAQDP